jgi:hypothetical protein
MIYGKGFFIWEVKNCEGGDPSKIVAAAKAAGLSWVAIKIADGATKSNFDKDRALDLVPPVVDALRAAGIKVLGWQYVYGFVPAAEARAVIAPIKALGLDGFIVDAEAEYEKQGMASAAKTYMGLLRSAFPRLLIALCSYRFPDLHKTIPWDVFLGQCDLNMPQMYWEQAHNPTAQLTECVEQFRGLATKIDILPVGPTYKNRGWQPTVADILGFQTASANLGLKGTGYFSWDECRRDLPAVWNAVAGSAQTIPVTDPPANPTPVPVIPEEPEITHLQVTLGPRYTFATSAMTGMAISKVPYGTKIDISKKVGRAGLLTTSPWTGQWVDVGSGVVPA